MSSRHFGPLQLKGLKKLGMVVAPGDGDMPDFTRVSSDKNIDRMLDYMRPSDLEGIKLLMSLFAFFPSFLIRFIVTLSDKSESFPTFIRPIFRMLEIGLKGIIYTLYYSKLENDQTSQQIQRAIKWDTNINFKGNQMGPNAEQIFKNAKQANIEIKKMSIDERIALVSKLQSVILADKENIINRIQNDTQKSKSDILISEMFGVLDHIGFTVKEAKCALADKAVKTPITLMGKKSKVYYESLGTMLIISPWNYPFYQGIVPIVTSFICGNATIYKPSEYTPLTGLIEDVLAKAGFKPNWVQVVYGDGKVGQELIDQRPDKIFFTGSVNTGKKIMAKAAEQLIPVELELGGKDPMIVFEDVNIDRAVRGAAWGGLTAAGQSCTSVERIYVQEKIYDQFRDSLVKHVKQIKQAVDSDGDADIGYMTTEMQVKIVADHIEDAVSKGAKLLTGSEWDRKSSAVPPLVLENVTLDMKIATEETFGPILPLFKFYDEAEVVELANDSQYGLSASVWSADLKRADRVARNLVTGNVSINNVMLTEGNHYLPFGGVKNSGFGRYKGFFGLHAFSNVKAILVDSNSGKIEANWYPYDTAKYNIFSKMVENLFNGSLIGFVKGLLFGIKLESYTQKSGKKGRS